MREIRALARCLWRSSLNFWLLLRTAAVHPISTTAPTNRVAMSCPQVGLERVPAWSLAIGLAQNGPHMAKPVGTVNFSEAEAHKLLELSSVGISMVEASRRLNRSHSMVIRRGAEGPGWETLDGRRNRRSPRARGRRSLHLPRRQGLGPARLACLAQGRAPWTPLVEHQALAKRGPFFELRASGPHRCDDEALAQRPDDADDLAPTQARMRRALTESQWPHPDIH